MRVAIMQPYLFPYVGYFNLAASVDLLVLRDIAQFPKGGWVNRNRLEYRHGIDWFTVPLQKGPQSSSILEKSVTSTWSPDQLLRKVEPALFGSMHKSEVLDLLEGLPSAKGQTAVSILEVLSVANTSTFSLLGLSCEVVFESALGLDTAPGVEGVVQICQKLGASRYYNPPGGRHLYSEEFFKNHNLSLHFVDPNLTPYPRVGRGWIGSLSILDALSQVGPRELKKLVTSDFSVN